MMNVPGPTGPDPRVTNSILHLELAADLRQHITPCTYQRPAWLPWERRPDGETADCPSQDRTNNDNKTGRLYGHQTGPHVDRGGLYV